MKLSAFVKHLLHRRCSRCYAEGFYAAAQFAERHSTLTRQGFSDAEAARLLDIRLRAR